VTDTNNLSLVTLIEFGAARILVPGDLETSGWRWLLGRDDFRDALRRTTVFVASHHGRESGLCEDVFTYCRPEIVIVSDKKVERETQEVDYGRYATGTVLTDGYRRRCLSTRNNGDIAIWGPQTGPATISITKA